VEARQQFAAEGAVDGRAKKAVRATTYLAPLLLVFPTAPAWACTLCHSPLAENVRAVLGPDFWSNAGALLLPVPVLLTIVVALRRYMP
jgi:hypothetical protein